MHQSIKFNNTNTLFSKSLKNKTNDYFHKNNIKKTGDRRIFLKAIILLSTFVIIYSTLIFTDLHIGLKVLCCILFGINLAAIGFNIMHDAGHNSFSENKNLNSFLSYSLNLLGGNIYFWKLKHNIAHHTYTNVNGEDHDIEIKFMRIHQDQDLKKYHRYQRFYFLLLYGISYFAWIFYQDYEKYFRQKLSGSKEKFHFPKNEKIIFWTTKIIHLVLFVVLPIVLLGWLPTLIGWLITGSVCGICLAVVFQLAHVVDETEFKSLELAKIDEEWMIHQIQSTANFSTNSKVLTWILGGLNFQVEHHLFPKVSHVHYPALNEIVKQTCADFNIKYNEYKTLNKAFQSHLFVIFKMSKI